MANVYAFRCTILALINMITTFLKNSLHCYVNKLFTYVYMYKARVNCFVSYCLISKWLLLVTRFKYIQGHHAGEPVQPGDHVALCTGQCEFAGYFSDGISFKSKISHV